LKPALRLTLMGQEEFARRLAALDRVAKDKAKYQVNRFSLELMNEAKLACPVDMGQLRSSIRPTYFQNGMTAEVSTNTGYGAFVEFGTGPRGRNSYPGPVPKDYVYGSGGKMPPLLPIKEWCKRKGLPPGIAFVIARQIGRKGLKARPFMLPAFEKIRPQFEAKIERIIEDAARSL